MPDLIRHPGKPLDSGSPLRFGRNDGRRDNYETVNSSKRRVPEHGVASLEVKMKILQFGADVRVLEPEELIREIREEIKKMQGVYGKRSE